MGIGYYYDSNTNKEFSIRLLSRDVYKVIGRYTLIYNEHQGWS
jgi:hypothetical protein